MVSELARQKAVQAWRTSATGHLTVVSELTFAFAEIIEEAWNSPILSNATTRDLLMEIETRIVMGTPMDSTREQILAAI